MFKFITEYEPTSTRCLGCSGKKKSEEEVNFVRTGGECAD
jgi:hypothetical protein